MTPPGRLRPTLPRRPLAPGKTTRLLAAIVLAFLAAAPAAARPAAGAGDPALRMYRLQGVGACIADNHPGAKYDLQVDDIFADCDCAIDRFMAGRDLAGLPRIVPGQTRGILDRLYAQCRTERLAGAPSRPDSTQPASASPAPDPDAPTTLPPARPDSSAFEPASAPPPDSARSTDFDPLAWLGDVAVPRWAWAAVPLLFVGIALLRRRRRSGDLLGPPPWMRPGGRPAPPSRRPRRKP